MKPKKGKKRKETKKEKPTNLEKFIQDDRSNKLRHIIANLQVLQYVSQIWRQKQNK